MERILILVSKNTNNGINVDQHAITPNPAVNRSLLHYVAVTDAFIYLFDSRRV